MSDTTSLDDLPVRGVGAGGPPLHAEAAVPAAVPAAAAARDEAVSDNVRLDIDVDPTVMNKVVTDIRARTDRQAGGGGGEGGANPPPLPLPERDIPREPHLQSLLHDSASSPNYVPPARARGGPGAGAVGESAGSVLDKLRRGSKREASVDAMFDDFKGVVFLAVVYYAFQMPYAHALLKRLFAFGYNEDGTTNRVGTLVGCVAFSVAVFSLNHAHVRVAELLG